MCAIPMDGLRVSRGLCLPDDLNALEMRGSSGSEMCGERRTGPSCMCSGFGQPGATPIIGVH